MTAEPKILVLGNTGSAEMRSVVATLEHAARPGRLQFAADLAAAARLAEPGLFPDLIIVCQHLPDEYSPADVHQLLNLFPLARLVCCFGLWCESDGRSRKIWPEAVRVPARIASTRIRHELAVLQGNAAALPLTAARDEAFEADYTESLPTGNGESVGVASPDGAYRRWLEDLLAAAGYRIVPDKDLAPYLLLWDLDPWRRQLADEIAAYRSQHENTAIIGLAGFASPERTAAAEACGVADVLGKLLPAAELLAKLETTVVDRTACDQTRTS